jgi:hypothetical protein
MRHQLYSESLLEKLKTWKLSNPDGTISEARASLRKKLSDADIDLLFDNWLNNNYERVSVRELKGGSVVAVIRKRNEIDPDRRRRESTIANRLVTKVKSNHFEEFAARIWHTALPSGILLKDATGQDMKHASGWYAELGNRMKATEKVSNKFSTKQLYDLSQRAKFAGV